MKHALLLAFVLAVGCSTAAEPVGTYVGTPIPHDGDLRLVTVEHDGHKFIVANSHVYSGNCVAIIHHPGCGCRKE